MLSIHTETLSASMNGKISFSPASPDALRIHAPFFHEDGDMYDVFIQEKDGQLFLCDFGMTLMRLSYKMDLDTEGKNKSFSKIVANNCVQFDGGNLFMPTSYESFFSDLMQYQTAVSKVSNLEVLRRESISNLFFEQFSHFIFDSLGRTYQNIQSKYKPTNESGYEVDFAILDKIDRPVYLMAVKDSVSALRATSLCLRVANSGIRHTSIAVHDSTASIASRDRDALTNAVDKQYTSLSDFESQGASFIARQIA